MTDDLIPLNILTLVAMLWAFPKGLVPIKIVFLTCKSMIKCETHPNNPLTHTKENSIIFFLEHIVLLSILSFHCLLVTFYVMFSLLM